MDKLDTTVRKNFKVGMYVEIVTKDEEIKTGLIEKILSKDDNSKGIKVRLTDEVEGRVLEIYTAEKMKLENFKFYNRFLYEKQLFSIWDKEKNKFALFGYSHHTLKKPYLTIFISKNKQDLTDFINKHQLNRKRYEVRRISNSKNLYSHFDETKVKACLLNNEKYISFKNFIDIENKIRFNSNCK